MSRTAATKSITKTMRDAYLREKGVTLLGGGLDEAPQAYKNINEVMAAQSDLVDIVARFRPRVVMMDGSGSGRDI
jgi:tRNA-splicing ligase RtcB